MGSDLKSGARVVILTGSLTTTPLDQPSLEKPRRPAIYEMIPGFETPLNLGIPRFRYRVLNDTKVLPVAERLALRRCHQTQCGVHWR
ncbi:MAG TPA: hypothetical protein VHL58_19115 [Thermoanaerobaculia bacterium]|nr:hypothetical protein [Thermoanaerobaculia bacterium]